MKELGLISFFIYKIVHNKTQKIYIGSTRRSLSKRIKEHFSKDTTSAIAIDLERYGLDAFTATMIDSGIASTNDEIVQREQKYIDLYDSVKRGYNLKAAKKNV
jgi:group I intron endonuclease